MRSKQCQNSAEQCHTQYHTPPRLQQRDELHQKDLRIIPYLGHIWDPENELFQRADTFLALSLIVMNSVPRDPFTARRVDIQYPRPCQITYLTQNIRI